MTKGEPEGPPKATKQTKTKKYERIYYSIYKKYYFFLMVNSH